MPLDINTLLEAIRNPPEKSGREKLQDALADVLGAIGVGLANRGRRGQSTGAGAALAAGGQLRRQRAQDEGAERQQAFQNALSVAGLQSGKLQDESTRLEAAMAMRAADRDAAERRARARQQRQPLKPQVLGGGQGDQPFAFDPAPPPGPGTTLVPSPNLTGMPPISSFSWGGGGPAAQVSIPPPEGWREEVTVSDFPKQTFENLGITLQAQEGGVVDRLPTRLEERDLRLADEEDEAERLAAARVRGELGVQEQKGVGPFKTDVVTFKMIEVPGPDGPIIASYGSDGKVRNQSGDIIPEAQLFFLDTVSGSFFKVIESGTREIIFINPTTGVEKRTGIISPGGETGPQTEAEKRAAGFLIRAEESDLQLRELEDDFLRLSYAQQSLVGFSGGLANLFKTQVARDITRLQRQFTEARLRKDSGAAINQSEFDSDRETYFPVAGNTERDLSLKRIAREAVLDALRIAANAELEGNLTDRTARAFLILAGGDEEQALQMMIDADLVEGEKSK
jgi:hypothetical protein